MSEESILGKVLGVIIGGIVGVLVLIGASIYGIVSTGVAVCYLWEWFMVPLGLMGIGFMHASGIATLVCLTAMSPSANYIKAEYKQTWAVIAGGLLAPWFALCFGYIIHSFM